MLTILVENLLSLVEEVAAYIQDASHRNSQAFAHQGKVLGLLFDEPSTRTRFSTASAALRLGLQIVTTDNLNNTSIVKGESIADTAQVLSHYFDIIAMRSNVPGLPSLMAQFAEIPVINLGDGANEHPTQALATLVSTKLTFNTIKGKHLVLWGDLEKGRVAHSVFLAAVLAEMRVTLAPSTGFDMPKSYLRIAKQIDQDAAVSYVKSLRDIGDQIDVLYITREQKERRDPRQEVSSYSLADDDIANASLVLHPLPRGPEISPLAWAERKNDIMKHLEITYFTRQFVLLKSLEDHNPFTPLLRHYAASSQFKIDCPNGICGALHEIPGYERTNIALLEGQLCCTWCMRMLPM